MNDQKRMLAAEVTPDTLIEHPDGSLIALMFNYAVEGQDLRAIAHDAGYAFRYDEMGDIFDEENALYKEYFVDGSADVIRKWHPQIPDGWLLGGKWDSENGPVVVYIRKRVESETT